METTEKESLAYEAMKANNVLDHMFPGNKGYKWVLDKKLQKSGVDIIVYTNYGEIYIDLKTGIGSDYGMHADDYKEITHVTTEYVPAIAIEIEQKSKFGDWWFTNSPSKMTDWMLYYTKDNIGEYFFLVPYEQVSRISMEHKKTYEKFVDAAGQEWYKEVLPGTYKMHTSFNGTGHFIKVPCHIFNKSVTYVIK